MPAFVYQKVLEYEYFFITYGRLNAYAQMIILIDYFKNKISNSFPFPNS